MTSFLLLSRVFSGRVDMHGAHGLAQEGGLQALALSPEDTREDIYPPLIAFLFLLHGWLPHSLAPLQGERVTERKL